MEFKLPEINENSTEKFSQAFGISDERSEELKNEIIEHYNKELEKHPKGMNRSMIVKLFVSHAKNIEEVAFLACQASSTIEQAMNPFQKLLSQLKEE